MKKQKVSIIGLGYVGLPLALRALEKGHEVFGIDLDRNKLAKIKKGQSPFKEEFVEKRKKWLKKLQVFSDFSPIKNSDIAIVCVPTPVDENYFPVLRPVEMATEGIAKNLNPGMLVIIESTVNPGVCEEVVEPIFATAVLKEGKDYHLAHCPERINPGDPRWNVSNISRVVGAMNKKGLKRARSFYESIVDGQIKAMRSIREAEAVKVVENSFRDINIAFVNELAQSFDQMKVDVKDVIEGASTKPFGYMPFWPTCGVGGHCIPVDPYYLIERAKLAGFDHRFLRLAREINNNMPIYTVEVLRDLLNEIGLALKGLSVGVLGLSYKPDVDDLRESPALEIIHYLKTKGAKVIAFDPFIPKLSDVKTLDGLLKKSQAVILATHHSQFAKLDLKKFKRFGIQAIVDGRNCLDGERIKSLGIKYHGIGRA